MDKTAQHRTALGRESEERIEVFFLFFSFSLSFFLFFLSLSLLFSILLGTSMIRFSTSSYHPHNPTCTNHPTLWKFCVP